MNAMNARPIPVLLYHAIGTEPSAWIAGFTVTPGTFARHLDLVVESGRTAITVDDLRAGLTGARPLPERPVLITFDDGFAELVEVAVPLLAERGLCSTAYLTTGFLGARSPGGDRMLSWSALGELAGAGHQLGGHSVSHPQLDALPPALAAEEINRCRAELQDRLGLPVRSFAYPHGYSSATVRALVRRAGFESACGVRNALSHPADNAFRIARLMVTDRTSDRAVSAWLRGSGAPLAPARESAATRVWRAYRRTRRVLGGAAR